MLNSAALRSALQTAQLRSLLQLLLLAAEALAFAKEQGCCGVAL